MTDAPSESGREGTTLTEVLAGYAEGGFASGFTVTEQAQLQCLHCEAISPPAMVRMSSLRRLEGESDPADMLAVVALTCPSCGERGTVVLGFGPMASAQDSTVLNQLRDVRGDAAAPGHSAPGESVAE
jgi:hypothetical protein